MDSRFGSVGQVLLNSWVVKLLQTISDLVGLARLSNVDSDLSEISFRCLGKLL